ncbi:hypothetical protein ACVBEQ_16395 [Nakamurella sp. GG22]
MSSPGPTAPSPAASVQRAAWRDLPPLRPTVTATSPVAPLDSFTASLATARNPSFLGSLGHVVDPDGPSGTVEGLAAPVVPQRLAAGTELPLPSGGPPSAGFVQRLITPWLRSAPAAAPPVQRSVPVPESVPVQESVSPQTSVAAQTPLPSAAHSRTPPTPTGESSSPSVQLFAESLPPTPSALRELPTVEAGGPVWAGPMTTAPETGQRATYPVVRTDLKADAAVPTVSRSAEPTSTDEQVPADTRPEEPALGRSEVVLPPFAPLVGDESSTASQGPGAPAADPAAPVAGSGTAAAGQHAGDRPVHSSQPSSVQRSLGLGAPLSIPPTVSRAPVAWSGAPWSGAASSGAPAAAVPPSHRPEPRPSTPEPASTAPIAPLLGPAENPALAQPVSDTTRDDSVLDEVFTPADHAVAPAPTVARAAAGPGPRPIGLGAPLSLPPLAPAPLVPGPYGPEPHLPEPGTAGAPLETVGLSSMTPPPVQRQVIVPTVAEPAGEPTADEPTTPSTGSASTPESAAPRATHEGPALVLSRSGTTPPAHPSAPHTRQPPSPQPTHGQRADEPQTAEIPPVIAPLLGGSPDVLQGWSTRAAPQSGTSPTPAVQRALSAPDTHAALPVRHTSGAGSRTAQQIPARQSPPARTADFVVQRAVPIVPTTPLDNALPGMTSAGSSSGADDRVTVRQMSLQRMFDPGSAAIASGAAYSDGAGSVIFHPPSSTGSASSVSSPPVQRFGLPSLPSAPSLPKMPSLPTVPAMPNMPSLPTVPTMPSLPTVPSMPDLSSLPGASSIPDASSIMSGARSAADDAGGYLRTARESAGNQLAGAEDAVGGAVDQATSTTAAGGIRDTVGSAASGISDAAGQAASGVAGLAAGAAGAVAGAAGAAGALPTDLNELARRLFDPLSARLKSELWLDRERAGMVTDLRR